MTWRPGWPATALVSVLAALATWVALWSWSGFTERASGFLVPALGGCLLVALTGALLRTARLTPVVVLVGQLAVLLLWLDHRWAAELAMGGWLPTPESLSYVAQLLRDGGAAAQVYAAPVPHEVTQLTALLTALGCATAVVVDFLACGLRRVPLAGLPLLAVYSAGAGVLIGGVPWGTFAVGALVFVFLLAADETQRLARWGDRVSAAAGLRDSQSTEVGGQAVWSSARKIGFTATALAVVAPALVPTLGLTLFDGNGLGNGNGSSVSITNPMADMKRDLTRGADVDLITVTTPRQDPSYLRVTVLDEFNGDAWKPSGRDIPADHNADRRLPRPPGLSSDVRTTEVPYTIETSRFFDSRWLPTPYPISAISADGDWRYDSRTLDFISAKDGQTAADMSYRLQALAFAPSAEALAASLPASSQILSRYTALPQNIPPIVRDLALQVTQDAPTRYQRAVRLQQWFRGDGDFTYSLERSSGNSLDQLVRFLGTGHGSRIGYCEQFATAMALMGRSLGIPSRVAVGFLRPEQVGSDRYVFSSHDLHAWPEMYFDGTGWVRFEPTPSVRAATVPAYTRHVLPSADPSSAPTSAGAVPLPNRLDRPTDTPGPANAAGSASAGTLQGVLVGAAWTAVVLALLATPALVRLLVRRHRWSSARTLSEAAEAGWSELRDTAADLRIGWVEAVSIRSTASGLIGSFARPEKVEAEQALSRLVTAVEWARYGRPDPGEATSALAQVRNDVASCTGALLAGTTARRRLLARWLPASLVGALRRSRRSRPLPQPARAGVDQAV